MYVLTDLHEDDGHTCILADWDHVFCCDLQIILQLIQNLTAQWCFFRLQCVFHCFVHIIGKEMIRLDAHVFYIFCDCIYIDRSHLYPPGDMGFLGTLCSCSKKPVLFYFTLFQDDIQVFFAVV